MSYMSTLSRKIFSFFLNFLHRIYTTHSIAIKYLCLSVSIRGSKILTMIFLKNRKTTLDKNLLTVIIVAVFISNMLINMIM